MHGHPFPLNCPKDRRRNSVAMYYYTNGITEGQIKYPIWDENKEGREQLYLSIQAKIDKETTIEQYF